MSEFAQRFYTLRDKFIRQGMNLPTAMELAIAQIQYEVKLRGEPYDTTFSY